MPDFLLEIGCEEIPAGYITPALEAFKAALKKSLEAEGLRFGSIYATATPRRFAFFVNGLPAATSARVEKKTGPKFSRAMDKDLKPTGAASGFARAQGVPVEAIEFGGTAVFAPGFEAADVLARLRKDDPQATISREIPPKRTLDVLSGALPGLIRAIPFPKSMYWRDPSVRFARPLRSLLALLGSDVVPFEIDGVKSGRLTAGHPFIAPGPFEMMSADIDAYKKTLKDAFVIVDREERRSVILGEIEDALAKHGSKLNEWELLEEVTDLVEWPEPIEGSFDKDFLTLPEEVVTAAMMEHQRYFPVRDASGKLVNKFVTVANRPLKYCDAIREGNERVLRARLVDARFFWDADRKKPLEEFAKGLAGVVYLAGLGTVAQKVERMRKLASYAAVNSGLSDCADPAVEAAALSKADLLTEMVYEFPSLQGVMGRAYAVAQGKSEEIALAIEEHYLPRTLSGDLPKTIPGKLVALADKADALAGAFVMGLVPSGSQDPYGLRRAAIGVVRIIVEGGVRLGLDGLLSEAWLLAKEASGGTAKADYDTLLSFVKDRLYQYYLDRGFRHDVLRACLETGFDDLVDFSARISAIAALSKEPFWGDLVTAVERTYNITKDYTGPETIDPQFFTEPSERDLYALLSQDGPKIEALIAAGDYAGASRAFSEAFSAPLHVFFDSVYVNVDDARVRANRLSLIKAINLLYSRRIADLAKIVQEGGAGGGR